MSIRIPVTPIHQAMQKRIAVAQAHRRETLLRAVDAPDVDELELMFIQADEDVKVVQAVRSYRHAGGCVYDREVALPKNPESRSPALSVALKLRGIMQGLPAASSSAHRGVCRFDSRYQDNILETLALYYRMPKKALDLSSIAPDHWEVPALAEQKPARRREVEEPSLSF